MRLNQYIARATGISRRAADKAIVEGRVEVNGQPVVLGHPVKESDIVTLDMVAITPPVNTTTIIMNKPSGYVCSREGQGSKTIYDLLPEKLRYLKPVGRLDKETSGLLILTNDGQLANQLTHPSYSKVKIYQAVLNKPLEPLHQQMISDHGIQIEDGISQINLENLDESRTAWQITMSEGRNRQIRRTFEALNYKVIMLHRVKMGSHFLGELNKGEFEIMGSL